MGRDRDDIHRRLGAAEPFSRLPDAVLLALVERTFSVADGKQSHHAGAATEPLGTDLASGYWVSADGGLGDFSLDLSYRAQSPAPDGTPEQTPEPLTGPAADRGASAQDADALYIPAEALRVAYLQAPDVFLNHPQHGVACAQQMRISQLLRCRTQFGEASESLLGTLETLLPVRSVAGGDMLCRQGEKADTLMIVLTGYIRPVIEPTSARGDPLMLPPIGPGHTVGELGVILGQPRSASLVAARDSEVLLISLAVYQRLLALYPVEMNHLFCAAIYRHLSRGALVGRHRPRSIALLSLAEGDEQAAALTRRVADDLAQALGFLGTVAVVGQADCEHGSQTASSYFHDLEQRVDALIYVTDGRDAPWRKRCIRQADHVMMVAEAGDVQPMTADERALSQDVGLSMKDKSLLLVYPGDAPRPQGAAAWRGPRPNLDVWNLRLGHDGDAGRVARLLTGQARGVVLGGGGARGFAHLGVLKALEQQGLAVDMIGGNSMGALIGAQYVQGVSLDDILHQTRRFAKGGEIPTLPLISLFGGRRIRRDLEAMFHGWQLEETWIPFFSVSCDLSFAEVAVHDRGALSQAVLASNSPAGLVPPLALKGHLHIDGAVLNNVPVDVMRDRVGGGQVIAVDVNQRQDLLVDPMLDRLSPWDALRRWALGQPRLPKLPEILVRAGIVGGIANRDRVRGLADLYIEPDVAGFPLIAYGQAEAIAAKGKEAALAALGV